MALYKDTNLTLYEVKHCVSGTCKANTRQWIHKLKLTCACDHPNITSHIFRHPCHHSRRPRVVRDWNHPIYMGLWPGAHFWGQGGGGHIPKGIPSLFLYFCCVVWTVTSCPSDFHQHQTYCWPWSACKQVCWLFVFINLFSIVSICCIYWLLLFTKFPDCISQLFSTLYFPFPACSCSLCAGWFRTSPSSQPWTAEMAVWGLYSSLFQQSQFAFNLILLQQDL